MNAARKSIATIDFFYFKYAFDPCLFCFVRATPQGWRFFLVHRLVEL